MKTRRLSIVLLAVAYTAIAATDESDPRTAKVTDTAGSQSQVSAIKLSAADPRFGFDYQDQNGRIVVATKDIEFAIPLRAVSLIDSAGSKTWTVKYQTKDGEASVSGGLPEAATLSGDSDFGAFSLSVGKLKRLEFSQTGIAAKPAKRQPALGADGKLNDRSFIAVLTLTDGTSIQVSDFRRHANYVTGGMDNNWMPPKYYSNVINQHFTDFRFIRGETSQTIPFDKIKAVDFTSGESVTVTTKSDAKAEMKLSQKNEETLSGFTGTSSKGDFYVPAKFVKSIAFGDATK
jgi:hypothetical protein